jgi:membrane protein insertase Oxa1/YidC/SpoIIIJ
VQLYGGEYGIMACGLVPTADIAKPGALQKVAKFILINTNSQGVNIMGKLLIILCLLTTVPVAKACESGDFNCLQQQVQQLQEQQRQEQLRQQAEKAAQERKEAYDQQMRQMNICQDSLGQAVKCR